MTPFGLCYLATPYTRFPGGIDRAFREAARIAAHLNLAGVKAFSPIAHGHVLAKVSGLDPTDPAVFAKLNEAMLAHCGVLIVAQMDGWADSDGVREEIAYFERYIKPIYDLDPASLIMTRRP